MLILPDGYYKWLYTLSKDELLLFLAILIFLLVIIGIIINKKCS